MFRRIAATLSLIVAGLLAVPALASAATNPPYPAPPVTPGTETLSSVSDPVVAYSQTTALASTGAGFSVGTALVIGAIVLVVGLALLVAGNRLRKSGNH
jgi:hypothetical protein